MLCKTESARNWRLVESVNTTSLISEKSTKCYKCRNTQSGFRTTQHRATAAPTIATCVYALALFRRTQLLAKSQVFTGVVHRGQVLLEVGKTRVLLPSHSYSNITIDGNIYNKPWKKNIPRSMDVKNFDFLRDKGFKSSLKNCYSKINKIKCIICWI